MSQQEDSRIVDTNVGHVILGEIATMKSVKGAVLKAVPSNNCRIR